MLMSLPAKSISEGKPVDFWQQMKRLGRPATSRHTDRQIRPTPTRRTPGRASHRAGPSRLVPDGVSGTMRQAHDVTHAPIMNLGSSDPNDLNLAAREFLGEQ